MNQTHLNELHQSGATAGQYCQWNGTHWVPATGTVASPYSEDTMGDADKAWTVGRSTMRLTATLTVDRTLTLPAANSLVAGSVIFLNDPGPMIGVTFGAKLILAASGSDTINNGSFLNVVNKRIASDELIILIFVTNGVDTWTCKGWHDNVSLLNFTLRNYTPQTLAVNTNRQPSLTNDVQVTITFNLACDDGETATGTVLVDNNGIVPFQTIATVQNVFNVSGIGIGGSLTIKQAVTFLCPVGSNYKWVAAGSGTTTVTDIYEILL